MHVVTLRGSGIGSKYSYAYMLQQACQVYEALLPE